MDFSSEPVPNPRPPRPRRKRGWSLRLTPGGVFLLLAIDIVILSLLTLGLFGVSGWTLGGLKIPQLTMAPLLPSTPTPSLDSPPRPSATPQPSATELVAEASLTITPTPRPTIPPAPLATVSIKPGIVILALTEGDQTHLFAYQPQSMSLSRLTIGPWDDITPAISPDGQRLAFASNRSGYWDLYLLDLPTGIVTRLTDSLEYDAAPSWSPDGLWVVHETYLDDNLELMIRPAAGDQPPTRLTEDPAADHSPAWAPGGRKIVFVSNRSGENDIWIADLDQTPDKRFTNLSRTGNAKEFHPAWSPDGNSIAWASVEGGFHNLHVWDSRDQQAQPRNAGSGDWPVWSSDGSQLLTTLLAPNSTYLTAYPLDTPGLTLPPMALPGPVDGLVWGDVALPWPLPYPYKEAAIQTPDPLWLPKITPAPDVPGGRALVVALEDVEAPHALMHDIVNESFLALRDEIAPEIGWDFLATLENAFVPLTSSLGPGMVEDWLYTGRAFAFNTLPLNAGWVVVVREDFGADTFWRVFLRARFQDGSTGEPLRDAPWDFSARFTGDPVAYEHGGVEAAAIPPGYWVDFTRLAAAYQWERLPALGTWRASYPAARFNEFAFTNGLDWRSAMLELYPPEVLITPTRVVPPTRTLTPTPRWYETPTPTLTPTSRPTLTPISPTPTDTPLPPEPSTPTPTPTITRTPSPTRAPTRTRSPTPTRPSPTPSSTNPPTGAAP